MTRGVFCCFFFEELGLGLGLGMRVGLGDGESLGLLPGEKKLVIWLCFRASGERPLLRTRRDEAI